MHHLLYSLGYNPFALHGIQPWKGRDRYHRRSKALKITYFIFEIIETTKNKRIYFEATNYLFDYARLNIMAGFLSVL